MGFLQGAARVLLVGLAVWAALVVAAWLFQRRLIYLPSTSPPPPASDALPAAEDVRLLTDDGLDLGAWWVPAGEPRSGLTVVVLPGNAADRENRAPLARALAARGHGVLLVDYRGYGGNPGRPSEKGLALDARAAVDWLARRDDVDPAGLVYFGESLGTGVAVGLALERPPAGLVLRSPFTSLVDAARHHFPILPVGLLLRDRFPSLARIGRIDRPVLFVVGTEDGVVPVGLSRDLFEAAAEPKRWFALKGADHNDFDLLAGEEVIDAIDEFLRDDVSRATRSLASEP